MTDPSKPVFIRYWNNRNYDAEKYPEVAKDNAAKMGLLGPEMLKYIPASKSPKGTALLLSSAEVSGNMVVFEVTMPDGMGASAHLDANAHIIVYMYTS